jgi:hypothetical protein
MAREDFVCTHRLRVRWAEVDMQKIVFNGHYLTYIDTAVADYWREIGLPYPHGYVERYGNDVYLRKATLNRFQHAVEAVADYDASSLRGFDLALIPKSKMFGRNKNPRLLGRYVSTVDGPAVTDAMAQAGKWSPDEICVFLLGTALAPASELAGAIAEQRKRNRAKVTLIPVDARDWGAYIPNNAPEIAKSLLARLKRGT